MSAQDTLSLVRRALSRDPAALDRLVKVLTPVVQARVARALLAGRHRPAGVRQEVENLCEKVFLALFSRDAHSLHSWQAERGSSLESFVGLVAERQVLSFLRGGRAGMSGNTSQARSPWKDGHE